MQTATWRLLGLCSCEQTSRQELLVGRQASGLPHSLSGKPVPSGIGVFTKQVVRQAMKATDI